MGCESTVIVQAHIECWQHHVSIGQQSHITFSKTCVVESGCSWGWSWSRGWSRSWSRGWRCSVLVKNSWHFISAAATG